MGNYKPSHTSISVAGINYPVPTGGKVVHLHDGTFGSNAADTLITVENAINYQVPTGKKFFLVRLLVRWKTNDLHSLVIWSGNSANAKTTNLGTVWSNRLIDYNQEYYIDTIEWAAGKFVVIDPSGTSIALIEMSGYEVNA